MPATGAPAPPRARSGKRGAALVDGLLHRRAEADAAVRTATQAALARLVAVSDAAAASPTTAVAGTAAGAIITEEAAIHAAFARHTQRTTAPAAAHQPLPGAAPVSTLAPHARLPLPPPPSLPSATTSPRMVSTQVAKRRRTTANAPPPSLSLSLSVPMVPFAVPAPLAAPMATHPAPPPPPPQSLTISTSVATSVTSDNVEGASGVRTRRSSGESSQSLELRQVLATQKMLEAVHAATATRSAHQTNIALMQLAATLNDDRLGVVVSDVTPDGYGVVALQDYDKDDYITEFGGLLTTLLEMRQLPATRGTHVRAVHDAGAARDGSLVASWFRQLSASERAADLLLPMERRTRVCIDLGRIKIPGSTQQQSTLPFFTLTSILSARAFDVSNLYAADGCVMW